MKSCIFAPEKNADDSVICDQTASWDGHLMYASSEEFRGPTCIISVTAYSFSDSIYNDLRRSTVASSLVSQQHAAPSPTRFANWELSPASASTYRARGDRAFAYTIVGKGPIAAMGLQLNCANVLLQTSSAAPAHRVYEPVVAPE